MVTAGFEIVLEYVVNYNGRIIYYFVIYISKMNIFVSGSARLMQTINSGYHLITPIHSLYFNYVGINFLGLLNNIKQHIQFIQFIKGDIIIPDEILPQFLTAYNIGIDNFSIFDPISLIPEKINNIKQNFDNCEFYLIEISSMILYTKTSNNEVFQVSNKHSTDYEEITQTIEDLLLDLETIKNLIPNNKKITRRENNMFL